MGLQQLNKFEKAQPTIKISRSKFDKSFSHKTTIKAGDLVPIYCEEILPGDTFVIDTNTLIRMNLPAVPIMDDLYCDIYYFWCPNRILTLHEKDWHQIIANENINGPWAPQIESTLQNTGNTIKLSAFVDDDGVAGNAYFAGNNGQNDDAMMSSVFNYLVNPVGANLDTMDSDADYDLGAEISILPFVGYGIIWNEWFRDENTQNPIAPKDLSWIKTLTKSNSCLKVSRFRDYFSTCLPSPQKGGSVALPLGSLAPVITGNEHTVPQNSLKFVKDDDLQHPSSNIRLGATASTGALTRVIDSGSIVADNYGLVPTNLWADLSHATAATISELRMAFAIQKMLETDARTGSRFREYLLGHFGISIPDNTVQVPEYLGGKRFHIDVNQVVQTAPGASSPLGNLGGISTTFNHSKSVVKSFDEHGYILGVCCIRPQHSYSQGIPKMWTRNRRFDWYDPKFANLSEQAVFKRELFLTNGGESVSNHGYDVFGYQEAWAEYRFSQNRVTGGFAPQNGLADLGIWTFADYYTGYPSLNTFNVEKAAFVGRSLVDTTTKFQFLCDFYFDVKAYRPMPVFSIPGLIDHH